MPTAFTSRGFRFYFFSNEGEEPMHVHVEKGEGNGKIWLEPVIAVAYMHGFSAKEEKQIMQIIADNILILSTKWNEHFNK